MKKITLMTFALLLLFAVLLTVACNGVTVTTENGTVTIKPVDSGSKEDTPSTETQDTSGESAPSENGAEQGQAQGEEPASEQSTPRVTTIDALIRDYPTQAKALGDKVAKALLKKYDLEDAIYCGYSFDDANENAQVSGMVVNVATKIDETERKFSQYKVVFDPIRLDEIADETASLTNTKVSFVSSQTYNAKEKQNDQQFLNNLYSQDDFSYVAYENETFEEQNLTIDQLLTQYGDTVNANLATHYDNVLKKTFGKKYSTFKDYVTKYQWDLGQVNEKNEIQNSKLSFIFKNGNSSDLYVYGVKFANPINVNDLKDTNLSSSSATYTQEYMFSYNNSIQGTRTDLVNAILQKAITDGFDYQNAEIMFKESSASTTSDLGIVRNFSIVIKNDVGIRVIAATIQTANTDEALINKVNNGKCIINSTQSVNYSSNLLDEYYTVESENN